MQLGHAKSYKAFMKQSSRYFSQALWPTTRRKFDIATTSPSQLFPAEQISTTELSPQEEKSWLLCDFDAQTGLQSGDRKPDVMNSKVRLQETSPGNFGFVASEDIRAGQLILRENAFCYVDDEMAQGDADNATDYLAKVIWNILSHAEISPKLAPYLRQMYPRQQFDRVDTHFWQYPELSATPDSVVLSLEDTVNKLSSNMLNAINADIRPQLKDLTGYGWWLKMSGFNHSCLANICVLTLGNVVYIRSTRDIHKGEELCFSYLGPNDLVQPKWFRQTKFQNIWEFLCHCPRCTKTTDNDQDIRPPDNLIRRYLQLLPKVTEGDISVGNDVKKVVMEMKAFCEKKPNFFNFGALFSASHLYEMNNMPEEVFGCFAEMLPLAEKILPRNHPFMISCLLGEYMRTKDLEHRQRAEATHQICYGGGIELFERRWGSHLT